MNIVICEDDDLFRNKLYIYIEKILSETNMLCNIVLSTKSAEKVANYIRINDSTTIYFLDIQLKHKMNGFDLAKAIRASDWESYIIFITAYSEKITLTYEYKVEALDYIVKDNENLQERIKENLSLIFNRNSTDYKKKLHLENKNRHISVSFDDIYYIEALKSTHRLTIYCKNGCYEYCQSLKELQKELDERFFKSHRSYIINTDRVSKVIKKDSLIVFDNDYTCVITKKRIKELKDVLKNQKNISPQK